MKRVMFGILGGVLLVSSSYSTVQAQAVEVAASPRAQARQLRATPPARETRMENQQQRIEVRQENRQAHYTRLIEVHTTRLERRFAGYAERFQKIIERLQGVIDAKKAAGADTSKQQAKLNESKTALESAITQGQAAITAFKAIDVTKLEVSSEITQDARQKAATAREAFQKVFALLRETLTLMKELGQE